jgi:hypothetical protein
MGDWLLSLPIPWMAIVVFAATYLAAACVYLTVIGLAVDGRARAFKGSRLACCHRSGSSLVSLSVSSPCKSGTTSIRLSSLSLAGALLFAGLAFAGFEITHAEALRPFMLIGALVVIGAAALWLLDEFKARNRPRVQSARLAE